MTYDPSFIYDQHDAINTELDRREPLSAQEALELIEFQIQDDYGLAPELRDAVHVLSDELGRAKQLRQTMEAVLRHFDECSIGTDTPEMLRLALKGGD